MSLRAALLLLTTLLLPSTAITQSKGEPCDDPAHHQFDFWIGRWNVSENGKAAGTNEVVRILGGCTLQEHWTGVSGSRGTSFTFYDGERRVWHQTWVDDRGGALLLDGTLQKGAMVLSGTRPSDKPGAEVLQRITWTPLERGRVRQLWQSSADGGKRWTTVFDGLYEPARN